MKDINSHGMNTNTIANVDLSLFEIKYNFTMIYFTSLIIAYRLCYATLEISLPNDNMSSEISGNNCSSRLLRDTR